jgi:hypothetical protein
MTIGKRRDMTSGSLRGKLDARFEPLRGVLEDSLAAGADCGLSLVVDIDGQSMAVSRTRRGPGRGSGTRS